MIIKYINFIMIALIIFFYKVHTILYRRRKNKYFHNTPYYEIYNICDNL